MAPKLKPIHLTKSSKRVNHFIIMFMNARRT